MIKMNRLGNVNNPYQTDAKRVLCVCSAGMLRSPTMANVLHQEYGYNTRAVGMSHEYALIPIDQAHRAWAQEIVFAEPSLWAEYLEKYNDGSTRLVVLDIPDKYEWNHPELRGLISKQYKDSFIMEKAFASKEAAS